MALTGRILIIDDEKNIRDGLKKLLSLENHSIETAQGGHEGISKALHENFDIIICDLKMPSMSGEDFLEQILKIKPYLKIIISTGHGTISSAIFCMKKGAYDFFVKPLDFDKLLISIQHALKEKKLLEENIQLKKRLSINTANPQEYFDTKSSKMKELWHIVQQVSKADTTILIEGESGTGKEVIAQSIYSLSSRSTEPFILINCGALNPNLLESELFGHEKGSFTGALQDKKGRFELAHKGTIFLDEIGELPLSLQVKLLRVLQEKQFERVGGEKTFNIDVRIIAATNKNLFQEVQKGNFREDLYYRLNVVNIKVPPLRERRKDIPLLVNKFIHEYSILNKKDISFVEEGFIPLLESYNWPGNIRELKNIIESMVVLSTNNKLSIKNLPAHIRSSTTWENFSIPLGSSLQDLEKAYILKTLEWQGQNKAKTAKILEISRNTLYLKLESFN